MQRSDLGEGEEAQQVGLATERGLVEALQISLGTEEEVAEHHAAKPVDGSGELFVGVVLRFELRQLGSQARVGFLARFLPRFEARAPSSGSTSSRRAKWEREKSQRPRTSWDPWSISTMITRGSGCVYWRGR